MAVATANFIHLQQGSYHLGCGLPIADGGIRQAQAQVIGAFCIMGKRWTEDEEQFLHNHYVSLGPQRCSEELVRSYQAIAGRAHALDLTKSREWARHWAYCQKCGTDEIVHQAHGLCKSCYGKQWQLDQGNICQDCGGPVQHLSMRCPSCESKRRWAVGKLRDRCMPSNICIDCGALIERRSTRCVECYKHYRKEQAQKNHPKMKCPKKNRPQYPGYIYVLQGGDYYKIGSTTKLDDRVTRLSTLMPFSINLICAIATEDMFALETMLHNSFANKRTNGEWFRLEPEDIEYMRGLQ